MLTRILTAVGIIAVVLPCIIYGGILLDLLILAFVGLGAYEILNVRGKKSTTPIWLYVVLAASMYAVYFVNDKYVLPVIVVVYILSYLLEILCEWYSLEDNTLVFSLFTIVAIGIKCIGRTYAISPMVLLYILIATYLTDTGAYFAGYFLGKHKLNPRISPKKTIEGCIGGWVAGALVSFVFAFVTIWDEIPFSVLALGSLLMPVVGQIGDLAFSAIKRHYQVKDFGNIFPGHGGVLDRIDSLLFNLMLFYILMIGLM